MIDHRAELFVERALFGGLLFSCLGSYFGNVFIAVGHGLLGLAIAGQGFRWWRTRGEKGGSGVVWEGGSPRGSTWWLLLVLGAILMSVAANLGEIESPLRVLKKARYHLIWAGLILTPGIPAMFLRKASEWAPWLMAGWLGSLTLATISGIIGDITGYNPLLLAPDAYPTRLSGVSSMVMTYAYGVQFSVLLLAVLLVTGPEVRQWLTRGRRWLSILVMVSLALGLYGLYFSYTRGALAGALAGAGALLLVQKKRSLLIWVTSLALAAGLFAIFHGDRYVSLSALKAESVRVSQWTAAWRCFRENPVFGIGYRQFEEKCVLLKRKYGMPLDHKRQIDGKEFPVHFSGHAHNEILEALASTGLFGVVAFLGFWASWALESCRSRRARSFFLPVIAAFFVSGMVQNMFTDSEVLNFILLLYFVSQMLLNGERLGGGTQNATPGSQKEAVLP